MNETFTALLALVLGVAAGFVFAKKVVHCETCDCEER